MATVYRRTYVRNGKKRKLKNWYIDYTDHDGSRQTVKGYTDKAATQQLAAKLERDARMIADGLLDPAVLFTEVTLESHLTDFESHLVAKKVSDEQVQLVLTRCRTLLGKMGITKLNGITADGASLALSALRKGTKDEKGISVQTSNHYLRAIKQFSRWARLSKRGLSDDPLATLEMLNVETDRRHDRRALSDDEVTRLLKATLGNGVVLTFEARDRYMLYVFSLHTGLRASELASLTPESIDLRTTTITVQAGYSKRRRKDMLPLPESVLEEIRAWLSGKPTGQPLWPGDWAKHRYAGKILQADLIPAGIPYKDASGQFADFHALRHTYITNLARHGVPLATAQKLARHSTPVLTAKRYTHIDLQEQKQAVDRLPALQCGLQWKGDSGRQKVSVAGSASQEEENPDSPHSTAKKRGSRRRGRDSNPGTSYPVSGFQDRCNRPLCHLSGERIPAVFVPIAIRGKGHFGTGCRVGHSRGNFSELHLCVHHSTTAIRACLILSTAAKSAILNRIALAF